MIVGPCTIVTGGEAPVVLEDAGVHIVGAHIAHVAHMSALAGAYPDEPLWPAHGRVMLPGLVNTHAHLARHLGRGLGALDRAGWDAYERALSPEDIYWSSLAALAEGLRHGVTTVFDFHRSGGCIELSLSEVVAAASDLGVRAATCYGVCDSDSPAARRAALEESLSFANEVRSRRQGTLRGLLGVRAGDLGAVDRLLREVLEPAAQAAGVHVELAMAGRPMAEDAAVWFGNPVPALWAHAETAPVSLIGLAKERGDTLSSSGRAGALAPGRGAAWGSDTGVNAPPSPETPPDGPEAERGFYERVLLHGALLGERYFGERFGRIEAGAPADLVLVDYVPATELSARTLGAHLAAGLLRAPVTGAIVAGEVVMDEGRMTQVDETEVAARARECATRLWQRVETAPGA
jgi:cytosine/adenosine deaminase-related metal-dependent hydrolase